MHGDSDTTGVEALDVSATPGPRLTSRKRDVSIDALRGFAIALVVLGHALVLTGFSRSGGPGMVSLNVYWVPRAVAVNPLGTIVAAFHMPLFGFVSGLVLWPPRDYSVAEHVRRRFRSLMVPFFSWFVVLYVVGVCIPETLLGSSQPFLPALRSAAMGAGGLWFLYAMFISSTVVSILASLPRAEWILGASAVFAIVWSGGHPIPVTSMMQLNNVLWLYPFVVLGYLLSPFRHGFYERRWAVVGVSALAFAPLLYLRHPIFVPSMQPITRIADAMFKSHVRGGWALTFLIPYVAALPGVLISFALFCGQTGPAIRAFAWLGRRSLGVYAAHTAIMMWLVGGHIHSVALLAAISLVGSVGITVVLERIPVLSNLLLGQPPVGWNTPLVTPAPRAASAEEPLVP